MYLAVAKCNQINSGLFLNALRQIKDVYAWPLTGLIPGSSTRHVALGRWVDTVCRYLTDGYDGLVEDACNEQMADAILEDGSQPASFELSLLELLRTEESVGAILEIEERLSMNPDFGLSVRHHCVRVLGFMLARGKSPVAVSQELAQKVKILAHKTLAQARLRLDYESVFIVLEAVGDEESLRLIHTRLTLDSPWNGSSIKSIDCAKRKV